jgi:hypothetical protein
MWQVATQTTETWVGVANTALNVVQMVALAYIARCAATDRNGQKRPRQGTRRRRKG